MKHIPNLFTLLNLFFGCTAIVFILQNGISIQYTAEGAQFIDIPEKIWMASLFIGLAAVVDFLDGFVARLLKATSEMGKQLDSLSDLVSFGVAPAMIFYQFLRISYAREDNGIDTSIILFMPAFIVALAAAYRLAKFNLDDQQQFSFRGLPTPATGLFTASLPMIYWHAENETVLSVLLNKWALYGIILFLAFLMVSNIPMMALKFNKRGMKANFPKLILLIISVVAILLFHWMSVPLIFISYILLSLLYKNKPV